MLSTLPKNRIGILGAVLRFSRSAVLAPLRLLKRRSSAACDPSPKRFPAHDSRLRAHSNRSGRAELGEAARVNEASQPGPLVSIARALLIAALVMLAACDIEPGAPPTVIVTQTQVIQPAGGSNTTPGVTPTPLAQRIASVRVGIFAQTCPMGGVVPANGANTIRVGCFAMFTATPKDSSGRELQLPDAAWDAMSVSWAVSGSACNDLDAAQGENRHNRFNREVRGEEAGTCSVCATVEGVGGCAVQPNGDRLVRVVS